jgi:hypothetical protein
VFRRRSYYIIASFQPRIITLLISKESARPVDPREKNQLRQTIFVYSIVVTFKCK